MDAVADAARSRAPAVPRGKPVAANLTAEGRTKGLDVMHASPRCHSRRKDGSPCKAPALRGATRCVKHGGRVEVPAHPHNLRRFFSGVLIHDVVEREGNQTDRDFWEALAPSVQREVAGLVSPRTGSVA